MHRLLRVVSLVSLVGCVPDELVPTPLAQFDGLKPRIAVSTTNDVATVGVELFYHVTSQCAALDSSFTATVGTVDVEILDPGSVVGGTDSVECNMPRLRLTPVPDAVRTTNTLLLLADDSTTMGANVGDPLVPRHFEATSHPDWKLQAGQPVTFSWEPRTDLVDLYISAQFTTPSGGRILVNRDAIAIAGDQVTFTVPAGVTAGTFELDLDGDSTQTVSEHHGFTHAFTIAP